MSRRVVVVIAVLSCPAGCQSMSRARQSVDLGILAAPYRVVVYESGKPASDRPVVPGSQEERIIARWLQAHSEGWSRDFVDYAPSRRIEGNDFNLNFTGRVCVLNYKVGPERWIQVSRPIDGDDALRACFESNDRDMQE